MFNLISHFCLIVENLRAEKDVWLIGDIMLRKIFHALPALRNEARVTNTDKPYLYKYYNILEYFPANSSISHNYLLRLVNSLTEALNKNKQLPRMIVLMPDSDLLAAWVAKFCKDFNLNVQLAKY